MPSFSNVSIGSVSFLQWVGSYNQIAYYLTGQNFTVSLDDESSDNIATANAINAVHKIVLGSFDTANSGITLAGIAFDQGNTSFSLAQVGYDQANTAYSLGQEAFGAANTAGTNATEALTRSTGAFGQANSALSSASAASGLAAAGFDQANDAFSLAQVGYSQGNTAFSLGQIAYGHANGSFDKANTALQPNVSEEITAGFYQSNTPSDGIISSGTYMPTHSGGAIRYITAGGAFSFVPPSNTGTYITHITNAAGAGSINTSSADIVTGDTYVTTNGNKFIFYTVVIRDNSHVHITALQ